MHAGFLQIPKQAALVTVRDSIRASGGVPCDGPTVRLASGSYLAVDLGIEGLRYGIAFLTPNERSALNHGDDLPPRAPDVLSILTGTGAGADAHLRIAVLLLYAEDYEFDEAKSGGGSPTEATARLTADVRDFVRTAQRRRLP